MWGVFTLNCGLHGGFHEWGLANPHTFISLEPKKSLVPRFLPSGPTLPNRSEFVLCVIVNPCRLHLFLCRLQTTFFRETLFAIRMTLYNIVFAAYYFLVCSYVLFGLMNRNELTPRCFSGMIRPSYNCIFDEWYQATREPGKRTFAGS